MYDSVTFITSIFAPYNNNNIMYIYIFIFIYLYTMYRISEESDRQWYFIATDCTEGKELGDFYYHIYSDTAISCEEMRYTCDQGGIYRYLDLYKVIYIMCISTY